MTVERLGGLCLSEQTAADGATAAAKEVVTSPPVGRSTKRHWQRTEEALKNPTPEQIPMKTSRASAGMQKSVTIYSVDSPRSDPGCSSQLGDEVEAGESLCSYSSQMDPGVHLVPSSSNRQNYLSSNTLMEPRSPPSRPDVDLSLSWTKDSKGQMSFGQFHQDENADGGAFGLKLVSVSGSTSTDCHMSESSSSAFEYEDGDMLNFALYRDQSVGQPGDGTGGKRLICSVCSKTYATAQNLDVHMRIHTGERPFSCGQCGKKFTQSAHLKSHLSVHSGERPYVCTVCSKSFIVKYSLKVHMIKCHRERLNQ